MADASINLQSVNLFGLGAYFNPQQTLIRGTGVVLRSYGATGLSVANTRLEDTTTYTQIYSYCGTDLSTDLGTIASAFGGVYNTDALGYGYISIQTLRIKYSATAYPEIEIVGHNHTTASHTTEANTKNVTSAIPASGFGVPDFGVTVGSSASQLVATLSIISSHNDVQDADGTHIHGGNTKGNRMMLDMAFVGTPTSDSKTALESDLSAITGFGTNVLSIADFKSNAQFTSFAFSAEGWATT